MVNFKIDGRELTAPKGTTILEAAEKAGIPIPHLCFLKGVNEIGACRMCVVEIEGTNRLVPSCDTTIVEGMVIHTNTPRVRQARRVNMHLLLSQHRSECTSCIRSGNCELQTMAHDLNVHVQSSLSATPSTLTTPSSGMPPSASSVCAVSRSVTRSRVCTFGTWPVPADAPPWT